VLVEGDDENEPVADTMRGLLDGHVWLSRRLAERGHFPAIDVLRSISRLMSDVTPHEYRLAAQMLRKMLAVLHENEDLLAIGAYRRGTNRELDVAVAMRNDIHSLLRQAVDHQQPLAEIHATVQKLAQQCAANLKAPAPTAQPA
jgi:flagellum-specific ATP synthase